MSFTIYNKGSKNKIAIFSENFTSFESNDIIRIAKSGKIEIHMHKLEIKNLEVLKNKKNIRSLFNKISQEKKANRIMKSEYNYILQYLEKNKINKSLFLSQGSYWSKKFMANLNKINLTACYFVDDPEGSHRTSKPYVKNFDHAFCGGIYFDKNTKIKDKYIQWGAKKSTFIPLGAKPSTKSSRINLKNRPYDLIYVGKPYLKKIIRLFKLKKKFGKKMLIFGQGWNFEGQPLAQLFVYFLRKFYGIKKIKSISNKQMIDYYKKTKIGFNFHQSYGPSNCRTYELPINGVMQICDCEKGLSELFKINEEVISFSNISEAIKKIEFYLKHDDLRIKVAKKGLKKSQKYTMEKSFIKMFEIITNEANKKFIPN